MSEAHVVQSFVQDMAGNVTHRPSPKISDVDVCPHCGWFCPAHDFLLGVIGTDFDIQFGVSLGLIHVGARHDSVIHLKPGQVAIVETLDPDVVDVIPVLHDGVVKFVGDQHPL